MRDPLLPGLYESLLTNELSQSLVELEAGGHALEDLDPTDGDIHIARHVARSVWQALQLARAKDDSKLDRQVEIANSVIAHLHERVPEAFSNALDHVSESKQWLSSVHSPVRLVQALLPTRPEIPLSASALLVNGRGQPRIGSEIVKELSSADRVDLLCAFIKWHGLRTMEHQIRDLHERGKRMRVITTTYMGATDRRALDALVALGAEVRISYDTKSTRLHAKAWLFERDSGFTTAYIGSSNLSKAALLDGLEWNVRVSAVEQPHIVDTFRATFESYWADPSFEAYDPARDAERFDAAISDERSSTDPLQLVFDVVPFPFQRDILEKLDAERTLHGSFKNLVIAATGTGKTVIAALDYRRLRSRGDAERLLFVAHRKEILQQSLSTFRAVEKDGSFGQFWADGHKPTELRHVFASVQTLAQADLSGIPSDHFDVLIVDEFHHAMADTYRKVLEHFQPKILLGLTATPERTDGTDIRTWFGGRIAVELRLWEALERGLLSPFQYFGIHDDVDVSQVAWKRGGYDLAQLTELYTANDARALKVVEALRQRVTSVSKMRAIGFCVSVEHAEFMAKCFNRYGIPSLAVSASTTADKRAEALRALRDRTINALFAVDLFNEGVDIPSVDTVLFLRPTESATIFLQQLGRGLRRSDDKPCLTVLDFIGAQNAHFRFDKRFGALARLSKRGVAEAVESGFPYLPPGCHIELDRVSAEIVLRNVKRSLELPWKEIVSEAKQLRFTHPDLSLPLLVRETGMDLEDLYRKKPGGWATLARDIGLDSSPPGPRDERLSAAFGRILHWDDEERLGFALDVLRRPSPPELATLTARPRRLLAMLHFTLWGPNEPIEKMAEGLDLLWRDSARKNELVTILEMLAAEQPRVTVPYDAATAIPLRVHASYSRDEALAAFGHTKPSSVRQGVLWLKAERADILFVTLNKTEKHYSPSTRYRDYALSPQLFHWESQNATSADSVTGRRYIEHVKERSSVHLFIRESKIGELRTPPYVYAGPVTYRSHVGDRPMQITWELERHLPAELFEAARVAA